ncbi:MAG: hypothetical protein U0350_19590 [Caldilineaceae bacterium]
MACITSPAITDDVLLAFIEGAATGELNAHIQQCAACRKRVKQLARQQNQLAAQLYRAECPSSLELGEYQLNLLPTARVATIEQHLKTCLHCVREIQTLQTFLADLDAAAAPVAQPTSLGQSFGLPLKRFIAKLVNISASGSGPSGLNPALAGLRGEQAEQHIYEVNGVQIVIEVQTEPERPGDKILLGLMLGLDAAETFEAQLEQTGQARLTAPVDELGNFVFEHLRPGHYRLLLRSVVSEIQIEALKL